MGGEVSTDFKSLNRIQISWLVQVLLNFDWFQGSPLGVGEWVDGGGGWWQGAPRHMHMHMHVCTCRYMHTRTHTHTCMYDIIGNSQGFPKNPMEAAICMTLSCLPHMHVCVCACACVWGAPPTTPHPHPNTPHPQPPPTLIRPPPYPHSCREPKTPKLNKSWTNRDNSILFEDYLPLNIPELI